MTAAAMQAPVRSPLKRCSSAARTSLSLAATAGAGASATARARRYVLMLIAVIGLRPGWVSPERSTLAARNLHAFFMHRKASDGRPAGLHLGSVSAGCTCPRRIRHLRTHAHDKPGAPGLDCELANRDR